MNEQKVNKAFKQFAAYLLDEGDATIKVTTSSKTGSIKVEWESESGWNGTATINKPSLEELTSRDLEGITKLLLKASR